MRIVIDKDLCEGNGICEKVSPEVFRVGEDDQAEVLREPGEALRGAVETAVRRCPRAAIRIEPD